MTATVNEIADGLRDGGPVTVQLDSEFPKAVRSRILTAAQYVGVRVSIAKDKEGGALVVSVLNETDAAAQILRSTVFRAANHAKRAIETLESELPDRERYNDAIRDLHDIVEELEESVRAS